MSTNGENNNHRNSANGTPVRAAGNGAGDQGAAANSRNNPPAPKMATANQQQMNRA